VAKFFAYFPYESCFFDLLAFKWQLSRVLNEPPQKRARTVEGLGQMLQNSDDCLSWSQRRFVGVHHDDLAKELRTVLEAKGFPSKPILVRLEGQLASYQADIAPEDRINPGYVPCLTAPSLLRFFPRDYYQMREILLAPGAEGAS
jgi:hypothetical protein